MKANMNVEGFAFCELEVEGSNVPPSMNMIDGIFIHEGFGIALPTLRLVLNDQNGSLSRDLNLGDATKINITLAKTRQSAIIRKFRVFGFRKETTHAGPRLIVDCILNVPKWSAGSYCEVFEGTSSDAMQKAAAAAGLRYDGPRIPPADNMKWLNVNQTRSSFSEDTAMRGYVTEGSCMSRVLLSNSTVRYRDLMDVLGQEPKASFLQNVENSAAPTKGNGFAVRETKDASFSGFFTHYINYGWKVGVHSLSNDGQQVIDKYAAKVLGKALPINEEVRGMLEGARISYVADDPGTMPKPASNIHQFYELAMYQNVRGLGLFSERVTVLTDWYTDAEVFDPVYYMHSELRSYQFIDLPALSGKWLIGGKTMYIKQGHKYSEIFDLYRPFVNEMGSSKMAGATESGSGASLQNAKANEGNFNLVGNGQTSTVENSVSRGLEAQVNPTVPSVTAATQTMNALEDFDKVSPLVPVTNTPSAAQSIPTQTLQAQDNLRQSISNLKQSNNPQLPVIAETSNGSLDGYKIVKKVSAPVIETLQGIQRDPRQAVTLAQNLQSDYWLKSQAMERATSISGDITGVQTRSVVSAATGQYYSKSQIVGDVLGGGVFKADFDKLGLPIPNDLSTGITVVDKSAEFGSKLLFNATGIGLSSQNVSISPYKTAQAAEAFAMNTNPQTYLAQYGAEAFMQTFGPVAPPEAQTALYGLANAARNVMYRYGQDEVITDSVLTNSEMINAGRDIAFLFGDSSVTPVIDQVADVAHMADYTEIDTNRKLVTWAQYYSIGASATKAATSAASVIAEKQATKAEPVATTWKAPVEFPGILSQGNDTGGYQNYFDTTTLDWLDRKG